MDEMKSINNIKNFIVYVDNRIFIENNTIYFFTNNIIF
jgi:hypothetical protein